MTSERRQELLQFLVGRTDDAIASWLPGQLTCGELRELLAAQLAHHCSEGVLSMTVARLGGMVEGHPTQRINFLQRIDELVAMENERHVPLTGTLAQRVEVIVQDAAKRIANHIHSYERRKVTIREAVHAALAEAKESQ